MKLTIQQFFKQFPDDKACLDHLFKVRFGQGFECPKCERSAKWYPIKAERAYSCQWCGNHLHPTVDTLFEKSRTSLQLWFYAIYFFITTRHGIPAKELQRKRYQQQTSQSLQKQIPLPDENQSRLKRNNP